MAEKNSILSKVDELAKKIGADKNLLANFTKDPVKTLEGLLGIDLPDDQINAVIKGIKAKLDLDKAGDLLSSIGGLFGKK